MVVACRRRESHGLDEGVEKTAVCLAAVAPADDEGGVWPPLKDLVQCGTAAGVTDLALDGKPDETDAGTVGGSSRMSCRMISRLWAAQSHILRALVVSTIG